jgi:peroxiredoxin
MSLKIGDTAPDFEADTTEGRIRFHDWIGDSWAVLFSHPKDFTPVCTTELGYMAKIKEEFERRNVKIIGLSIDSTGDHEAWARDIEETQGAAPNYPLIGDSDFQVSKLYGMLPADTAGDAKVRTPADNQQLRRGAQGDRLAPAHRQVQGGHAGELAPGRGRDHRRLGHKRRGQGDLRRLAGAQAVYADRASAARIGPRVDRGSDRRIGGGVEFLNRHDAATAQTSAVAEPPRECSPARSDHAT